VPSNSIAAESDAKKNLMPPVSNSAEFTDYSLLDHKVSVQNMRAGNQDESGLNDYFFTATMVGIVVDSHQEATKEEKSFGLPPVNFGNLQLKALDRWESNPKLKQTIEMNISGDDIRKFIAEIMVKFAVEEKDVAVRVDLALFEKNKKFYFFGEDQKIAVASYFPVPSKGAFAQQRQDNQLLMQDGKSTFVNFFIKYKTPLLPEKKLGASTPNVTNKK
jgi:hypothetical protein